MAYFLFGLLVVLVVIPLAITMKNPARIFEYPFFMAFAFAVFIVPQAAVLIPFPGFVEDSSVTAMLVMCCLCIGSCFLGYSLAPSVLMLNFASKPLDMRRLFRVGILFTTLAYVMEGLLSVTAPQYATDTGGLTGTDTILMFFMLLAYPGFAIEFICALRRPSIGTVAMCIIGIAPLLEQVIIGRRENSAILILTIVMSLFYERRVKPMRLAIVAMLIFATLAIPATTEYRGYANENNWSGIQQMDLIANFQKFASEGSILELRNGAAIMEAVRETGDYQLGRGYWNNLVFRYVPAQFLGRDFKNSLMFDVFDVGNAGGSETGIKFSRGSTITGMADTFMQFGWFGCLFFAFMGVLFKGMWVASLAPDAHFARLMYMMTITSGMRAVTHWTADFLPGLIFFGIFLGAAGVYAGVPRNRLVLGLALARR